MPKGFMNGKLENCPKCEHTILFVKAGFKKWKFDLVYKNPSLEVIEGMTLNNDNISKITPHQCA